MKTVVGSPKRDECHTGGLAYRDPVLACQYLSRPATWAVLGNSHGVELAFALASELDKNAIGLKHYTFSGCPPTLGQGPGIKPECAEWTQKAIREILGDANLEQVVISYRTHGLDHDEAKRWEGEAAWTALVGMSQKFVAGGKRVTLVLQAPEMTRHVEHYLMSEKNNFTFVPAVSRQRWQSSSDFIRARMAELPKAVQVIDPADHFCDTFFCAAIKDGVALYFDRHHMSVGGAALIAPEIVRRGKNPKT
jgi:SGNH domain (fused to AT3 domains)